MRKIVFVQNIVEVMTRVRSGYCVEGSIYVDEETHVLSFKPYHRRSRYRMRDKLIRVLEHGWVKESPQRIKVFESVPKVLGSARVLGVIDREMNDA